MPKALVRFIAALLVPCLSAPDCLAAIQADLSEPVAAAYATNESILARQTLGLDVTSGWKPELLNGGRLAVLRLAPAPQPQGAKRRMILPNIITAIPVAALSLYLTRFGFWATNAVALASLAITIKQFAWPAYVDWRAARRRSQRIKKEKRFQFQGEIRRLTRRMILWWAVPLVIAAALANAGRVYDRVVLRTELARAQGDFDGIPMPPGSGMTPQSLHEAYESLDRLLVTGKEQILRERDAAIFRIDVPNRTFWVPYGGAAVFRTNDGKRILGHEQVHAERTQQAAQAKIYELDPILIKNLRPYFDARRIAAAEQGAGRRLTPTEILLNGFWSVESFKNLPEAEEAARQPTW
jgi:hypothetical protein